MARPAGFFAFVHALSSFAANHVVVAPETSCSIEGDYAPVCPGTAPRAANGCCWRNGKSENIDNFRPSSGPRVVSEDYEVDEDSGESLQQIVCDLDKLGCQAADSGDWGDSYSTGDSSAVDTIKFFIAVKSGDYEGAAESAGGRRRLGSLSEFLEGKVKDYAKEITLDYVCDHAKDDFCTPGGDSGGWGWGLLCLGVFAVGGLLCLSSGRKQEGSGLLG